MSTAAGTIRFSLIERHWCCMDILKWKIRRDGIRAQILPSTGNGGIFRQLKTTMQSYPDS